MTLLLAWMTAALAGTCPQPSTSSMLAATLSKADGAFVEMDLSRFEEAHFAARGQLECLEELLNPADAAAYHRLEALSAFVAEDDLATRSSFRASLSIQPRYTLPERIAPPGNPLDALYGEAAALGPSPTAPLTLPPDLVFYVDGTRSEVHALAQPFILQGVEHSGEVGHTAYVPEGNPVPAWAIPARPEEPPPPPPEPVPQSQAKGALFIASGTTIAIAGVLYGYAWGSRGLYDDPGTSLEDLDALRTRTNTATVTSLVMGGVGAGLLVVAVVVPVTTPEGGRKYKVLGTIGRGGFGTVYRAELAGEGGFSKVVALKVLNRDVSDIKEVAERMRDEARVLGLVHHRAIVHVDGLLQIDGRWTIVMEWVNGVDLKRVLEEGPIPPGPALEIVTEVASALRAAKEQPGPDGRPLALLHRDLKPSNLHLTPAGEVKVLDFGTARADFASREAKTEMVAFGTLDYMSPERLIFEDVPAGDIYALGAVLYEMLMGEPLGRTNPGPEKHQEIRHAAAQKLAEAGVHEGAVSLIREMIAYEPEDRPTLREVEQRCRDLRVVCGGPWLSDWAADMVPEIRARLADAEDTELAGVVLEEGSSTHYLRDSVDGETQWIRADAPESGEMGGGRDASGPGQAVATRATADPDAPTERAPRRVPMMLLWGLMGGVSFLIVVAIGLGLIFLPRLGGMVVPTEDAVTGEPPAPEEAVVEDGAEPDTAAVAATPEPEPVAPDPILVPKSKPVAPRPAPKPSPPEPETAPPPAPTPTPGPAPAPTGTVVVEGDAVKVELVADGKRFPPGKVAPGSYTVEATFTGRGAVQAGAVTVLEGQTVTISCQRAFARCTVR